MFSESCWRMPQMSLEIQMLTQRERNLPQPQQQPLYNYHKPKEKVSGESIQ